MAQFGYVTMRNQDGTQWAAIRFGDIVWEESKRAATPISRQVFDIMEATQENTRKRDCPDNGFYGVYNLKFTPI
jgi:hypothetical protein